MPSFNMTRRLSTALTQTTVLPAVTVAALLSMAVMPASAQTTEPTAAPVTSEATVSTQPFVGEITADRVYVRSGPGTSYYEIGQLSRGDKVNVVGQRQSWYRISPPAGTFCYLAKELVEVGGDGKTGTVKAEYANVRAASASTPNSDYAVLAVIRRGTAVNILGAFNTPNHSYYRITPPENALMYVSPQFVRPVAGAEYSAPTIKAPSIDLVTPKVAATAPAPHPVTPVSATAPATQTAEGNLVPATAPKVIQETMIPATALADGQPKTAVTVPLPSSNINKQPVLVTTPADVEKPAASTVVEEGPATAPAHKPVTTPAAKKPKEVIVAPQPAVQLNRDAYATFNDLNSRTQAELQKPLLDRKLGGLLAEYKTLLAQPNLPPSVKSATEASIGVIERIQKVQNLASENTSSDTALNAQRQALQQQWSESQKKIDEYERTGPYLAEGKLQTSTALKDKYVLVNPTSGRVIAYIDPSAPIELSALLGQYIGVRGTYDQAEGLDIKVIKVRNAMVLPQPGAAPAAPADK